MFDKGDVYTTDGVGVRWVGVVTKRYESGHVQAIEMAYHVLTGTFVGLQADAYFDVDRPGQRVLLQDGCPDCGVKLPR